MSDKGGKPGEGICFIPVSTDEDIAFLSKMAIEIWNEYWPPRIGQAQTDYMLDMMLSIPALTREMDEENYRYWILQTKDGRVVGFTGGATEEITGDPEHDSAISRSAVVDARWPKRFFISKVYLYETERGKHYSTRVMEFYERLCSDEGLPAMYLTVNRENDLAIRAYLAQGFIAVEDVDNPIGNGFFMYDHIMAKEIGTGEDRDLGAS